MCSRSELINGQCLSELPVDAITDLPKPHNLAEVVVAGVIGGHGMILAESPQWGGEVWKGTSGSNSFCFFSTSAVRSHRVPRGDYLVNSPRAGMQQGSASSVGCGGPPYFSVALIQRPGAAGLPGPPMNTESPDHT